MKRKNKAGMVLIIVIGFIAGIAAEMLIHRCLPWVSPDMSAELVSFIATIARIALSAVIVFLAVLMKGDR